MDSQRRMIRQLATTANTAMTRRQQTDTHLPVGDFVFDARIQGQIFEIGFGQHPADVHHLLQRQGQAVDAFKVLGLEELVLDVGQARVFHQRVQDGQHARRARRRRNRHRRRR